jgi:hypothetical protein
VARLIYFAGRGELPLTAELERAGHTVFEALALSEVLRLIDRENVDAVLFAPEISQERRAPIQRRTTMSAYPRRAPLQT